MSRDSVVLIGSDKPPTSEFVCDITPATDSDQPGLGLTSGPGADEIRELRARISQDKERHFEESLARIAEQPPTVFVWFHKADQEIGWPEQWSLSCRVSRPAFDELADDILHGRCSDLSLTLSLFPPLTDSYFFSWPSEEVKFGVMPNARGDTGTAWGHVNNFSWRRSRELSSAPLDNPPAKEPADDGLVGPAPAQLQSPRADVEALSRDIQRLASTVRSGFILLLILLAVVIVLR